MLLRATTFVASRASFARPFISRLSLRSYSTSMGGPATQTVDTTERLAGLRNLMREKQLDAFVVPSEDPHSSEYAAQCDERRAFISGFNGSAGTAIVAKEKAYLFTDGRYFLQAEQQLDQNWTLMKQGLPDVPTWQDFIMKHISSDETVGMDAELVSAVDAKAFDKVKLQYVSNLVDPVWGSQRPARPTNPVVPLALKYAGQSHVDKITAVREKLAKDDHGAVVVNMLDEVAWLFNLRGSDIDFNPVFLAYAVVTADKAVLFLDPAQASDDIKAHLGDSVQIHPYNGFYGYLTGLSKTAEKKILIGNTASVAVANALGGEDQVDIGPSPVQELKAIKNETEVDGFRASHIRDGVALARYFAWLEERLAAGDQLSESQGADQLEKYRSELEHFKGLSFTTISSTGPNGAIIHYSPDPVNSATIKRDDVYLCDSGAQFLDGTTDVTRTFHFGSPSDEEKRAFTRVLQGHIAIDTAVFPNGTTGYIIDTWARRALWKDGLDYRHGTGHGVGHFLNVHEGPQGIGTRIAYNSVPLKSGMTVSNEPGYYADGRYGIRIENVVVVREANTPNNFGDKGFLCMEHLTMCPIGKNLIEASLLSLDERQWLDAYHAEVYEKVSSSLSGDSRALEWLKRECAPL